MLTQKMSEEKLDTLLSTNQIPIIDLAHSGTEECPIKSVVNKVGSQLQKALAGKGLALLVNHGISEEKLKTGYALLDEFCKLSDATKEHYLRTGPENHGYIRPGQEKFDGKLKDLRHTYNICTLGPNANLPEEPIPGFREHIADLAKDFKSLSSLILQALAVGLNLHPHFFTEKHQHMLDGENANETTFRLLFYPPLIEDDDGKCEMVKGNCKYELQKCTRDQLDLALPKDAYDIESADDLAKVTRCGAHCDYGTFTLLAQDSEGGLEVKMPGTGRWCRVGYLPGAILINTGEILSTWTDKKYLPLEHRVIIPKKSYVFGRHSIAFFVHPDNDVLISPIEQPSSSSSSDLAVNKEKTRKKSFKLKVYNAYQHVQKRFRETYAS